MAWCHQQCSKLLPVRQPEADNFGGGPGIFKNFSSILCLWFEIQGCRTDNFFYWVLNTAIRHQAITWTNVNLSQAKSWPPSIYQRAISHKNAADINQQKSPYNQTAATSRRDQWVNEFTIPYGTINMKSITKCGICTLYRINNSCFMERHCMTTATIRIQTPILIYKSLCSQIIHLTQYCIWHSKNRDVLQHI